MREEKNRNTWQQCQFFIHAFPNNVLFTAVQAEFSEAQFPKCDNPIKRSTQVPHLEEDTRAFGLDCVVTRYIKCLST